MMHKATSTKIYSLLFMLLLLAACNDYLEENPDNRVELNTLEKSAQLLTNAYSQGAYTFTEWMSDMVTYTLGTQKLPEHNMAYRWEEITRGPDNQDTPAYFWNETYSAIAHANEVLAVVDELPGDEARRRAVKGEALLTRAYGHFMLVNLFGEDYDASTAAKDKGIPYVEEPETEFIKQYERLSVRRTYDKIEEDMLAGLSMVSDAYYSNSGKYHFTKNAALAFASRFYLYKREYEKCIDYSSQLLGNSPGTFVKDIAALKQERVNDQDYIRLYTSPSDPSNILLIRQVTTFPVNVGYWPDAAIYNGLFNNTNPVGGEDQRSNPAYVRGDNGLSATKFEYLFERTSLTSNVGNYYTIALAFRGEEVLLNRAEALFYLGREDDMLADLQLLAEKRYTGNEPLTIERITTYYGGRFPEDGRAALFIQMLSERQKEFIHEGLRWFDIKRFDLPVTHILSDGSQVQLSQDDKRKVLQIPQAAQDIGDLDPNP